MICLHTQSVHKVDVEDGVGVGEITIVGVTEVEGVFVGVLVGVTDKVGCGVVVGVGVSEGVSEGVGVGVSTGVSVGVGVGDGHVHSPDEQLGCETHVPVSSTVAVAGPDATAI
jgi:hypothetical protein